MGEQRVLLKHHPHAPAVRRDMHRRPGHDPSLNPNLAPVRTLEAGDQPQDRGLATTAGTQDGQNLARLQRKAQAIHRCHRAVALRHTATPDDRH